MVARYATRMRILICVITVALAGCGPKPAPGKPGEGDVSPTISMEDARKIALAKVPGTIDHEKLKTSKKKATYSFKIAATGATSPDTLTKVEVDGQTGKITKVKEVKRRAKGADDDDD